MYDIYVRLDTLDKNDTEDRVLWAPGLEDKGYILYTAILNLQLNHSGKLTFQMSPKHPLYNRIAKRKTRVIIRRNGREFWRGRVLDSKNDFYKRRTVVCEGALSYLLDTTMRPYNFKGTFKAYMEYALNIHNSDCDEDKKIYLGRITAVDPNTEVSISNLTPSEYPSTLDELNDKAVSQYGGYLEIRVEGSKLLLDYLSGSGKKIDQQIKFGKNLLDLEDYITAENVCTRCIPLGATLREIEDFKLYLDPNYVSSLKDEDANKRLNITSVTGDGSDYIEHNEGKALFGKITRCIVFENIVTPERLLEAAQEWLDTNVSMNVSIQIKAIDLSLVLDNIDAIDCGVSAEIVSNPHEIDTFMLCSAMTLNILSPSENDYTFGAGFNSMTDQQAKALKQSSKAFDAAKSASASSISVSTSISSGQYFTSSQFNAFKEDLDNRLKNIEALPEPTDLDNGKVLKIVDGKWVKADDDIGEAELPSITDEDEGKVLKIVNGQWVKSDDTIGESELPIITEDDDGKILKVVDGKWVKADDAIGESELPPVTEENNGMILKVVDGKWTAVESSFWTN